MMFNWFSKLDERPSANTNQACLSSDRHKELVDKGSYHGRPVRMYSDGSVKAGTRDGWIRFRSFDEFKQHFHLE